MYYQYKYTAIILDDHELMNEVSNFKRVMCYVCEFVIIVFADKIAASYKLSVVIYYQVATYVTEFWKITLMGAPEIIRIFEFTTILLTSKNTF